MINICVSRGKELDHIALKKVLEQIATNKPKIKKGLGDLMGGKILKYKAKDILNEGIEKGRQEGIELGAIRALYLADFSIENISARLNLPIEKVETILKKEGLFA